jgi:hypothetical protein
MLRFMLAGWLMLVCPAIGLAASTMNVQVQNGTIRTTPSFLGKLVVSVVYGSSVEILKQQGDWFQVKSPQGQIGWMHKSALTKNKIAMSSGSTAAKTGASSDELALAGKGFNSDVEKEFKAKNKNLNFAAVDRMEKIKISPTEMQTFLQAGGIKPSEGGVQ